MSEHDLEKLLGGFAADTLTPEEKQQLYSAALHDQELFNALADEQALKELLADPVVRRRLLQSLQPTHLAATSSSPSWLDWLRRPSGLAWAGGFATVVLAAVLGTRIYQDSLKEAVRSVATEETKPRTPSASAPSTPPPTAPSLTEPPLQRQERETSTTAAPKKEVLASKLSKRESTAPTQPQERRARTSARDTSFKQHEQDALPQRAEPLIDKFSQSKEDAPASPPQTPASVPAPTQTPTGAAATGQAASTPSARDLFYGASARPDSAMMAEDNELINKPSSESAQRAARSELKKGLSAAGKTEGALFSAQPLGIRYSLVANGLSELHRDRDAGSTNQASSRNLRIEANQDGYLQVWGGAGSLQLHLLFPKEEEGPISSKLIARQRRSIPLPSGYDTVTIRFSRVPFSPPTRQGAALSDRFSPAPLQDSTTTVGASGSQEQVIYVVNQDVSQPELLVSIPMNKP